MVGLRNGVELKDGAAMFCVLLCTSSDFKIYVKAPQPTSRRFGVLWGDFQVASRTS